MKNYTNEYYTTIRYEKLWTSSYNWKYLNRLRFFKEVLVIAHNRNSQSASNVKQFWHIFWNQSTILHSCRFTLMFCIHDIQSLDLSISAILDWVSFCQAQSPLENSEMAPSERQPSFSHFFMFCISLCLYSRRKLPIFPRTGGSINNFLLPHHFQFLIHISWHYITNAVKKCHYIMAESMAIIYKLT